MKIRRAWAEINTAILRDNFMCVKERTTAKILAMVKANAYGHGAVEVARIFAASGADMLGVACAAEAEALRLGDIKTPILIAGYVPKPEIETALCAEARLSVSTLSEATEISRVAQSMGKTAILHIKVDTGMTRLGFLASDPAAREAIKRIFTLPQIAVEGIFTHFPCADEGDASRTEEAFAKFVAFARAVETDLGVCLIKHAANSATIFRFPKMHLDMVRPGICLYGGNPLPGTDLPLTEAMTIRATIARVANVKKGTHIGYGATFCAAGDMQVATVLIGYGDGFSRSLSNCGHVIFKGKRVPIVGRICMDQLMIDVTGMEAEAGDVVTVRGREGSMAVTTEETAEMLGTISYELFCAVGGRIPRYYV